MFVSLFGFLLANAAPAAVPAAAPAAPPSMAEQALAVVERNCIRCHGDNKASGKLRLADHGQFLAGGSTGPTVVPGRAQDSLLYRAVSGADPDLEMPPSDKLPAREVEILRRWIDAGAPWPKGRHLGQSTWWSFRPPLRPPLPVVSDAQTPVDRFIQARLEAEDLTPSPPADKGLLVRRAYFDLHGLPPSPAEARAFLDDSAADAWPRLVDKLLASPRYGERWGRHYLDVVRYADTTGYEKDPYHLDAWRYRDWVIRSFNDDKPYDSFVREQLAGDELDPENPQVRMGTGFFRIGPNRDFLSRNEEINAVEKMTDWIDTTSSAFLGLSVACARCHDHKFDPIPQRDFYRLQAVFAPAAYDRIATHYQAAKSFDINANAREFQLRQLGERLGNLFGPYRDRLRKAKVAALPPVLRAQAEVRITDDEILPLLSAADRQRADAFGRRLVTLFAGYGSPPLAAGIADVARTANTTHVAVRGNPEIPGEAVKPGFLAVLGGGDIPAAADGATTSGRRRALADWLVSKDNPLFARVMVNRLWQWHFGEGLVRTPNDLGQRAGHPSHPELLDWLTSEFVARGYSIKAMHRILMNTDVYRRGVDATPDALARDPGNRLLSHMTRRRLSAEEIRDAVLATTGSLNNAAGGLPVVVPLSPDELEGIMEGAAVSWPVSPNPDDWRRRSVYLLQRRTFRPPMMEVFDKPDGSVSCPRREDSTTAPQSLSLLNSSFLVEQARVLGERTSAVEDMWQRVLGRPPTRQERDKAGQFLVEQARSLGSSPKARAELARVLFNLNEFLYVD